MRFPSSNWPLAVPVLGVVLLAVLGVTLHGAITFLPRSSKLTPAFFAFLTYRLMKSASSLPVAAIALANVAILFKREFHKPDFTCSEIYAEAR